MELKEEIREIIVNKVSDMKRIDKASFTDATNLKTDCGMKSVDMVSVITALEDEYEVYVDFLKLKKCETLGSLVDFVAGLIES